MRRLHVFEFGDQPWFPQVLRDAETWYLAAAYRFLPLPRVWAEKIATVFRRGELNEILDLCSGSGGAMAPILGNCKAPVSGPRAPQRSVAALSDIYIGHFRFAVSRLHDNARAFQIIETARGRALAGSIRYARQAKIPSGMSFNREADRSYSKEAS
jgi:hypothetical protein